MENRQYYTVTCAPDESLPVSKRHNFVLHDCLEEAFHDSFDAKTREVTGYVVALEGWSSIQCQTCKAHLDRFLLSKLGSLPPICMLCEGLGCSVCRVVGGES